MITPITTFSDFQDRLLHDERFFVLLYKPGSDASEKALQQLKELDTEQIFVLDVTVVGDVHKKYGITSVPTILYFKNTQLVNVYKGAQTASFYRSILEESVFASITQESGEAHRHTVMVYSTPTCPWCTVLKDYLRKNRIDFRDVDVSRDQQAAQEMVNRSGQQGVPQCVIDGEVIIGFDQKKINKLLQLNNN